MGHLQPLLIEQTETVLNPKSVKYPLLSTFSRFMVPCLLQNIYDFQKSADTGETKNSKGIAGIGEDVLDEELEYWGSCGIVGAQFCMLNGMGSLDWNAIERLAWGIHDFSWHVELTIEGADLHEVEQRLSSWPNRIVINHIGRFLRTKSLSQRGFKSLTRLIDRDKAWVKLSAPYESSAQRRLDDPDVSTIARALVDWAPERMVWGSNWPFYNKLNFPPSDAVLFDMLTHWVPEESRRDRILVANPIELYGFDELAKD